MKDYTTAAWRGRIPRLSSNEKIDICRGLFAFLVVAAHAVDISWVIHPEIPQRLPRPVHDFLLYVVAAGVYWVIGFFVISGYCIQLSVERQLQEGFSLRNYLLARLSRILPLYYLALLAAVVAERFMAPARPSCWPQGIEPRALLAQLFVVQNLTQTYGSFAPSWSITNEMFYYVLYGLLVTATVRLGLRSTLVGLCGCLVLALALDAFYFSAFHSAYIRTPGLLFGLGILWFQGALVAEHRQQLGRSPTARRLSSCWPLVLFLAMGLWYEQVVHLQVVYLVLGAAFTLMLVRFVTTEPDRGERIGSARIRTVIRTLGLASYPTYLFHGPLIMLTGSLLIRCYMPRDWRLTWMLLTAVGVGSGLLLGQVLERPIMAWRASYLQRLGRSRHGTNQGKMVPVLSTHQ